MTKASDLITKINELSTQTLTSYKNKAIATKPPGFGGWGTGNKKHDDRFKGILKATDIIKDRDNPIVTPKVHDLSHMDHGDAYDHTQTSDHIKDGDVLKVKGGGTAIMMKAWPTMVTGQSKDLHSLKSGTTWDNMERGRYKKSAELARSLHGK